MMGYDEPSSKRSATATAVAPAQVRSPKARLVLIAILLIGVVGFLAVRYDALGGMIASLGGARAPARTVQSPPVRVAIADSHDVPVISRTIGTVLANSVVNVKSQVDGPLLSAMFKEGQMVKKGDLLFRIDPAPFEAALRQAEANAERDRAQLASAKADAERAVMLSDRGIVSTQQRDQLVATQKALAATLSADEALVDRAKLNLGYTTIRSPIDGKTGPFIVYPGNQVHANDVAGLVTITQIQPVKITFNLPQGNLPQLQARMSENELVAGVVARSDVAVITDTVEKPDMDIPVKVDFIGNTVDQRTGTIELRATFDNPDQRLVPGELVDVNVRLETIRQASVVPREAVNVGQSGEYVFVIDNAKKAQMRPVKVLFQDQMIAALGSGVEAGETVVIDGQLRLTPGISVSIVGEPNAPASNGGVPAAQAPAARTEPVAQKPQGTRSKTASREGTPG
jgi:multidrug efflux system membrane fusion protein